MSEKNICPIIRDLLPLYVDKLVSEESAFEIEAHLKNCPDCREYFEHMKSDLLEDQSGKQEETNREINYLKKIKKNNAKKVFWGAVLTFLSCILILAVNVFFIGKPNNSYCTTYVNVTEDLIHIGGSFTDSASVYDHYKLEKTGEGIQLIVYSCLSSPWNRNGTFNLEIPRNQLQGSFLINETTVMEDGTVISAMANRLYENRNPYIGDASANGRLCQVLGIANELGNFTNELQTSDEPYGWTLLFENSVGNSAVFDEKMKGFSCILMALTENLGEVTWEYTVELAEGAVTRTRTMNEADCTAYLGSPVKDYGKSPLAVQELLQLLTEQYGFSFYTIR